MASTSRDVQFLQMEKAEHSVNPDLQKERDKATFDVEKLTYVIDGSIEQTLRRRYIASLVMNDPELRPAENRAFMTRNEAYDDAVRRATVLARKGIQLNFTNEFDLHLYRQHSSPVDINKFGLHWGMFKFALKSLSSEQQLKKWWPMYENYVMIGTYAQTEMGHGTFVRGLETTATYDPSTREFVLHTPKLTSLKWWPGDLGKTVNHAMLMAQLYTKGKCHGVHAFLVQIRSLEDHKPLPGITVGDIGPKFGYRSADNGYLGFDHVRIPRENMMMRYAKVEVDGTYISPPAAKLEYGTMVAARVDIAYHVSNGLLRACTIATRYSAVRRQTPLSPGQPELQVIDYQSQQYKLFPALAMGYAFHFASQNLSAINRKMAKEIAQNNFSSIKEVHALSACMKAYCSYRTSEAAEVLRLGCGGHGYSEASGFPAIYTNILSCGCTYEGENSVMLLQTARYLIKCLGTMREGAVLKGTVAYLSEPSRSPSSARGQDKVDDLDFLSAAYQHRAFRLVSVAGERMQQSVMAGVSPSEAWNATHVDLIKAASAHCQHYVVSNFVKTVREAEMDNSVRLVLGQLCQLYALHGITTQSGDFLQDGYLTGAQVERMEGAVKSLLTTIRPNAVALVDAVEFPDEVLNSVLGRYDGNVYENLYKWAQNSTLNKSEVHDSYYKYLRPLISEGRAKL